MSERVYQVTHTFLVRLFCDHCEGKGKLVELKPVGVVLKKYQHVCPNCGIRKLMDRPYPATEHRLVELQKMDEPEQEQEHELEQEKLDDAEGLH